MLRSRLRLSEPDQQTDPILKIPDSALEDIILGAISAHNPNYTLQTLPQNEVQFVMWLAMIDVYYAIATESAIYYEVGAQGAQLNRQQLFEHYSKLAAQLQDKYDKAWKKFIVQTAEAESTEVLLQYRYTPRSYRLKPPPSTSISVIGQTPTSIDLQWNPIVDRQIVGYRLYQFQGEIIDEFNPTNQLVNPLAKLLFYNPDVWRTKWRATDLIPGEVYNFAVYVEDVYGRKGWSEISIMQPTQPGIINPILSINNSGPTSVN